MHYTSISHKLLVTTLRHNKYHKKLNLLFTIVCLVIGIVEGTTTVGFYSNTCPQAETIVRTTVESHFNQNPAVAPDLLKMHFHDCLVRGCDASVLISGPNTERTAPPNLSLRGFEAIDEAKAKLEAACPNVVSCADILALAARDSVVLTKGIYWPVPTGRRDGRISIASEANALAEAGPESLVRLFINLFETDLPGMTFSAAQFAESMTKMGNIGVKTGTDGEIRKVCSVIN